MVSVIQGFSQISFCEQLLKKQLILFHDGLVKTVLLEHLLPDLIGQLLRHCLNGVSRDHADRKKGNGGDHKQRDHCIQDPL